MTYDARDDARCVEGRGNARATGPGPAPGIGRDPPGAAGDGRSTYSLIEALQYSPEGLTDAELAARTGLNVQAIRETMGELANAQIVEILPPPVNRAVPPDQPVVEQAYRLRAI